MTRFVRCLVCALGMMLVLAWDAPAGAAAVCVVDADCDDGVFCNGTEFCLAGDCVAVSACPPFVNGCVVSMGCDEATDTCLVGPDDSLCDDGVFCNGVETCDGETGGCVAVSACPPFIDGCVTSMGCDEATDTCLSGPDDSLCTAGQTCLPTGECVTTTTSTVGSTSSTSTSTSTSTTSTSTTSTIASTTTTVDTSTTTSSSSVTSTVTTIPSTTTTTLPGTMLFPPATKLLVKQKKSGVQRLVLIARGADVAAALPCDVEGELAIESLGAASPTRFPLEAGLWKPLKAKKPEKGCKYRKGPVVAKAQLKVGKMLKVIAVGEDLGLPLATDPRPVRIEVRHGDRRHCFEFGGTTSRHKADKKLLAKKAIPATTCPGDALPSAAPVQ